MKIDLILKINLKLVFLGKSCQLQNGASFIHTETKLKTRDSDVCFSILVARQT